MKKIIVSVALVTCALTTMAQQSIVKIAGTRLTYPLFQQWINEYSKTHAGTTFILDSSIPVDSTDILIASYALQEQDIKAGKQSITVSRYVQLPIVNSNRKDLALLQERGFTEEAFRQVYFTEAPGGKPNISTNTFTVYTRDKPVCASKAFANHFGNLPADIHGVGINGDDHTLLNAVKKDSNGISYNNLGFIYDLQSRKVVDSIAVVPIDINGNGKIDAQEKIYSTLDDIVSYAQKTNSSKLVIENVNVIINKNTSPAIKDFLLWILKQGQQYNRLYGFLQLNESALEDQLAFLSAYSDGVDLDALYGKQN